MDIRSGTSFNSASSPTPEFAAAAPAHHLLTTLEGKPRAAPSAETADALYEAVALAGAAPVLPPGTAPASASALATTTGRAPTDAAERRLSDVIDTVVTGVRDGIAGVGRNVAEAVESFFRGFASFVSGKSEQGLKEMGGAALRLLQTPVDAALLVGGSAISAAQTFIGLEPVARKLSAGEAATLRHMFGDSIDLSRVRIKEGNAGLLSLPNRPFTLGNTIYSKDKLTPDVLAHEMTHVWQHQSGGDDYLSEALLAQLLPKGLSSGYHWAEDSVSTPWSQLNPEQQGQFIQDATNAGAFNNSPPRFEELPLDYPCTLDDLNHYLDLALLEIRQGHGAA
jgi:hypothetical protein